MKIIDAHLHLSGLETFIRTAATVSEVDYSYAGLLTEMREAGVVAAVAMGLSETAPGLFPDAACPNPMGINLLQGKNGSGQSSNIGQGIADPRIYICPGINPEKLADGKTGTGVTDCINGLKQYLDGSSPAKLAGIKLYPGYYPYYVFDRIYDPVYEFAASNGLPVVIHCGDTFSERGLVKYSQPIHVDELAVRHRNINFVICHLGDPWVMDCAELVLKNPNVYADLSGLLVGNRTTVDTFDQKPLLMEHFIKPVQYANSYGKLLFGTDWPLVPIAPYIAFVKKLIPEEHHEAVFYRNALTVFNRISNNFGNQ